MTLFRDFMDNDAKSIIEAIRETYGEEYSPKFMYNEEYLFEATKSGKIKFTVATTEGGEFIGVIGLKTVDYFLGTVEVISLVVKKMFQKLHIGTNLFRTCMNRADRENVSSVYGSVAVINDYSQRIMSKLGYRATGFWLNRKFFSDKIKGGRQYKSDKVNMIVMVRNNRVMDAGVLYLPKHYMKSASDCYGRFSVKFQFCTDIEPPNISQTVYTQSGIEDYYNTNFFVYNAGKDFNKILTSISLLEKELSSVSVFIDVKNKSAVWAIEQLENLGCKLTGFLPLANGHEYAIFHLCRCSVYYDEFSICELFNNIKK